MAGRRFGIDLSPDRLEVWVRGEGLVLQEPAVVARQGDPSKPQAIGVQARRLAAEAGGEVELVAPFGIFDLRDRPAAELMVRQLISKVVGRLVFVRHELVLAIPAQLSTSARRLLLEVALASGARMAHLLDLPLALAFGAGLPVTSWEPLPVLFLLPGSAQGAIVCHHGLLADRALEIPESDGNHAPWLSEPDQEQLLSLARDLIAEAPPPGAQRIRATGFSLAGRGVDLAAVGPWLSRRLDVPVRVVSDPDHCVVKGAEVALERIEAAGGRTLLYLR